MTLLVNFFNIGVDFSSSLITVVNENYGDNGTFAIFFSSIVSGAYSVHLYCGDGNFSGSPFSFQVSFGVFLGSVLM